MKHPPLEIQRPRLHTTFSRHAALLLCSQCGQERPELAFPRTADGRGQPCRLCGPHGTPLAGTETEAGE